MTHAGLDYTDPSPDDGPQDLACGDAVRLLARGAGRERLDRFLTRMEPALSRAHVQKVIAEGQALVAGRVRKANYKLQAGEEVTFHLPEAKPVEILPEDIPLDIRYEDDHLLVVEKPAGLVVHPAAGNLDGTLVNALLHHCAGRLSGIGGVARPGIVHRIDKDTSGLLVVAKTDRAHAGLAAQFAKHIIGRRYLAVVAGLPVPPAGRIETNLARSDQNRQKIAVVPPPRGKHAVTHYRVLQPLTKAALVECRLETGRTHQVRVHMAHIGHPLVGDPVYGQGRLADVCKRLGFHRQALHAAALKFEHPVSKEILTFESPAPDDIQQLLIELGQA